MIFRQFQDPETSTFTYLLGCDLTKEAVLIDPVKEQVERDLRWVNELGLKLVMALETHVHADHITGAAALRARTGCKVGLSKIAKATGVDLPLEDGQTLKVGELRIEVMATPGHTNTCTTFRCGERVFTGDVLFIRDCGRTDFQEGSTEKMWESIQRILTLPTETKIYPAHDYKGQFHSTVGEERAHNPKIKNGYEDFKRQMDAMKLPPPKKLHIAVPANLRVGAE